MNDSHFFFIKEDDTKGAIMDNKKGGFLDWMKKSIFLEGVGEGGGGEGERIFRKIEKYPTVV